MTALASLSDIANRLTGGNSGTPDHPFIYIDNRIQAAAAAATVVGRISSLWRHNKTNGGNGAIPGTTAAACDRTTLGALGQANPGGGRQKWLLGLEGAFISSGGTLLAYDRLLHVGGLSGIVTTAQTVGGTITRNTGGVGNQIWAEIYTQIGATATTITASYTNESGTAGRTTRATVFGGTNAREESRIIPMPLQDGDTGVQSVQSCTVLATTATAGNFGITLAKPMAIALAPIIGGGVLRDFIAGLPSTPEIVTDQCLAFAWMAMSTSHPNGFVGLHMVEA